MEWTQFTILIVSIAAMFLALIATTVVLFLWNRTESRADARNAQDLIESIKQEVKDFHGRLCAIEERRNKFIFKE
jgi:uncharacterized membrane protein